MSVVPDRGVAPDIGLPLTSPAGRAAFVLCSELDPVCRAGRPQSVKPRLLFVFVRRPCPIFWHAEAELNQYGPLSCAAPPELNLVLFIVCVGVGWGLSLSQISGIHQRFRLHLISYLGAPRVANEDNVHYWLHLAYRDRHAASRCDPNNNHSFLPRHNPRR